MNFKQYVKDHEGEFKHRYIYAGSKENPKKVGVIVVDKDGHFGWSFCSEKDSFSKDKGKAIALLRAQSGKTSWLNIPNKWNPYINQAEEKRKKLINMVLTN